MIGVSSTPTDNHFYIISYQCESRNSCLFYPKRYLVTYLFENRTTQTILEVFKYAFQVLHIVFWIEQKSIELKHIMFFKKFIYFIYFWLRWVFVAAHGLSLVAASRCYSSLRCAGFSLRWLLLLQSRGSRCTGFSGCGTWAQ